MKKAVNRVLLPLLLILASLATLGAAQSFNAQSYYQSCLRFEAAGNYVAARENCLNALELDKDMLQASVAVARIDIFTGETAKAEARLSQLEREFKSPEVFLLSAQVALAKGQLSEADVALRTARELAEASFDNQFESRYAFLFAQLAEARSEFQPALDNYRQAISLDGLDVNYRLSLAGLLYRLGDLDAAAAELKSYQSLTGDTRNPEILSLLGRVNWSQQKYTEAVNNLETAVNRRDSKEAQAQTKDLATLALIYYGQGNAKAGGLALRAATSRGTSLLGLLNANLLWLVLLVLTLGLHLWGESRITSRTTMEVVESPEMWKIGDIYSSLILSLLAALAFAVAFSVIRYDNYLAMFTPHQATDVRAVYFLAFSIILLALTIWRVRRYGWEPFERLFGSADQAPLGLLAGVALLGLVLAYLAFKPSTPWLGSFYLDFANLTPLLIGAAILIPLNEIFFRSFIVPSLSKRYNRTLALLISGTLFALVLASPLALLVLFGLALAEVFRRTNSGINPVIAQLVLHVGLVVGVAFVPWVRGLFI